MGEDVCIFALLVHDYQGNHNKHYPEAIAELLLHCEVTEKDVVIALDMVESKSLDMEKHVRKIKSLLKMPELNIKYSISQKEKGIQIADAIAGSISKEYFPRADMKSFCEIILSQMSSDPKRVKK